ncbi:MAG: NUDIX domain-containing protein [Eubacteriales bacterium]
MAEYWDLYDLYGNLTEEKYLRDSDAPFPKDKYHIVVEIYTVHRGCLLLTKRDERKPFGGLWEYTGGSVVAGEDARTGAARELAEETGISRAPEEFIQLSSYLRMGEQMNWLYATFLLVLPSDMPRPKVIHQEGETVDHIWLNRDAADAFVDSPTFVGHVERRYREVRDTIWKIAEMKR